MSTSTKALKVKRDNLSEAAPVFCQYQGQLRAQPAYIELDENGNVCADYSAELGGTPGLVWHNRTLTWSVNPEVSGKTLQRLLTEGSDLLKLLQVVHEGHEVDWNGSNLRGKLNETAQDASDQIERLLAELDPTDMAQLWSAEDWLFAACGLDDHWPAGKTLDTVLVELEAQAKSDGVTITDSLKKALLDRAHHLAQRGALEGQTTLGAEHLEALLAANYKFDEDELDDLRKLVASR